LIAFHVTNVMTITPFN